MTAQQIRDRMQGKKDRRQARSIIHIAQKAAWRLIDLDQLDSVPGDSHWQDYYDDLLPIVRELVAAGKPLSVVGDMAIRRKYPFALAPRIFG